MSSDQLPVGGFRSAVLISLIATALLGAAGCGATTSKTQSRPVSVQTPVTRPATADTSADDSDDATEAPTPRADPRQLDRLDADLARAIASATPTMSPDALDAHIRKVTQAPYSMIVAPYDPKAQPDSEEFGKRWVAGYGTDAAITEEFEGIVHDSRGKPHRDFDPSLIGEPLYFAGRPVRVRGRAGYVLVARTAR
ncbi:MAG: hypothetical protein P4L93_06470 [Coriobacteriia bacterium]|nr:hypothetical protein [Coriobacteriia bacterium]